MNKIKSTLLIALLIAGASHLASAQAQFAVGIKGGLNFANLDVSKSAGENYDSRTGYHAGAFALIKLGFIGIQPELIFSRQGSKYTFNSANYDLNYDYINVPVMAKFYLPLGLNLQAGPQFGFLTKAQLKQTAGGSGSQDIKSYSKNADVAIGLGAGWDLPFGLTVDARYNLGVSKVNDNSSTSGNVKNRVFQVSVGYKLFKFGK
jgi:hypothetical protein